MTSNRKPSRSISDCTKFDCQCGHEDCQLILQRKLKAIAHQKEILLASLAANNKNGSINSSGGIGGNSPLPALFRRLSLFNKHTTSEAKEHGKVKRIFFSPHPDDVAYSCFGLVSSSKGRSTSYNDQDFTEVKSYQSGSSNGSMDSNSTTNTSPPPSSSPYNDYHTSNPFEQSTLFSALPNVKEDERSQNENDNWIVTVFSKSRCANGIIGQSLGHCVRATTELRQREDETFAKSVGAKLISLDLRDTSARDEGSRHPELLAKSQSSLSSLSVNHPKFDYVKQRIRPYVEWAIECQAIIHIPVAVGCHIDHWMVRVAILSILYELEQENRWVQWSELHNERSIDRDEKCENAQKADLMRRFSISHNQPQQQVKKRIGSQLIFYEDLPYAFLGSDDTIERTVSNFLPKEIRTQLIPLTESDWTKKVAAVKGYASQLKPDLIAHLHDHALLLAKRASTIDESWINAPKSWTKAERSWVLDDICGSSGKLLTSLASQSLDERRTSSRSINKNQEKEEILPLNPSQLNSNSPLKPRIQFNFAFDTKQSQQKQFLEVPQILSPRSKTYTLEENQAISIMQGFSPRPNFRRLSMSLPEE